MNSFFTGLVAMTAFFMGVTPVDARSRPALDGDIAIREELCAARVKATKAAYDLFIARHPDHPLAVIARSERADLAREKPRAR